MSYFTHKKRIQKTFKGKRIQKTFKGKRTKMYGGTLTCEYNKANHEFYIVIYDIDYKYKKDELNDYINSNPLTKFLENFIINSDTDCNDVIENIMSLIINKCNEFTVIICIFLKYDILINKNFRENFNLGLISLDKKYYNNTLIISWSGLSEISSIPKQEFSKYLIHNILYTQTEPNKFVIVYNIIDSDQNIKSINIDKLVYQFKTYNTLFFLSNFEIFIPYVLDEKIKRERREIEDRERREIEDRERREIEDSKREIEEFKKMEIEDSKRRELDEELERKKKEEYDKIFNKYDNEFFGEYYNDTAYIGKYYTNERISTKKLKNVINVLWSSHGSQHKDYSWFLFPFKSLSFVVPNGHLLFTKKVPTTYNGICMNYTSTWVKTPLEKQIDKDFHDKDSENICYSEKILKSVWSIINKEVNPSFVTKLFGFSRINTRLKEQLHNLGIKNQTDFINVDSNKSLNRINLFIENIIEYLTSENQTKVNELLRIYQQTRLIRLRNMTLQIRNKEISSGIHLCVENKSIFIKRIQPLTISLQDALQILEDTLINYGGGQLKLENLNIIMVCCRTDMPTSSESENVKQIKKQIRDMIKANAEKRIKANEYENRYPGTINLTSQQGEEVKSIYIDPIIFHEMVRRKHEESKPSIIKQTIKSSDQ